MIAGLDSSASRPTPAQARAAFAAGVRVWGVYLPPGAGLFAPWSRADVQVLQDAGLQAIGFASGNDDPGALAATAASWSVRGCLDDEPGIRAGTGWQQAWLDASGFGLYGRHAVVDGQLLSVHVGIRAAFHIAAWYPGADPGATWPPGTWRPDTPTGWQWQGTHEEFGCEVDRSWLDDWFAPRPALGGGGMALVYRPDGSGTDWFGLSPDRTQVLWESDTPDWTPGADSAVPGLQLAAGVVIRERWAAWKPDMSRLLLSVVTSDGVRRQNVMQPAQDWSWGSWEQMPGTWGTGAAAATVPPHDHQVTTTGTTGPAQ